MWLYDITRNGDVIALILALYKRVHTCVTQSLSVTVPSS